MGREFPGTSTSSSGGTFIFNYEHELELYIEHALLLALIFEGDFPIASRLFKQMDEVYRPSRGLERQIFVEGRHRQIDIALARTRTVKDVLVTRNDCRGEITPEEVTARVMGDLPLFRKGGRHVIRYMQKGEGKLFLVDY